MSVKSDMKIESYDMAFDYITDCFIEKGLSSDKNIKKSLSMLGTIVERAEELTVDYIEGEPQCPMCTYELPLNEEYSYCPFCGQKLSYEWSE